MSVYTPPTTVRDIINELADRNGWYIDFGLREVLFFQRDGRRVEILYASDNKFAAIFQDHDGCVRDIAGAADMFAILGGRTTAAHTTSEQTSLKVTV